MIRRAVTSATLFALVAIYRFGGKILSADRDSLRQPEFEIAHPFTTEAAAEARHRRFADIDLRGNFRDRCLGGKVEIGQGIVSALAQIAAEELDVDYARIRMIPADTGRSPNEGVTAGSRSTMDGGGALRQACAEVRDAFLQAAARRLDARVDELFVRDGTVHRKASNESATYWELSTEVDLSRDADGRAAPKRADELTLVGKKLPRLDLPADILALVIVTLICGWCAVSGTAPRSRRS